MTVPETEEQREVRNALTKKTFTLAEEEKMLAFICAETKIHFERRAAKRYETESVWLAGAIRLFTGMTLREVCALQWSDFVRIPQVNGYQLLVHKRLSDDGMMADDLKPEDWKRFRRVQSFQHLHPC